MPTRYPLSSMVPDLTEVERPRCDAFVRLTRIEVGLRRALEAMLPVAVGRRWVKALPPDIQLNVVDSSLDGLYFPDLKKIVANKWSQLTEFHDLGDRQRLIVHLEELEPIRNDIAHSRAITVGQLALVDATYQLLDPILAPYRPRVGDEHPPGTDPTKAMIEVVRSLQALESLNKATVELVGPPLATASEARTIQARLAAYERIHSRPGHSPSDLSNARDYAL